MSQKYFPAFPYPTCTSPQGRHYLVLAGATSVIYLWHNLASRCSIRQKLNVPGMLGLQSLRKIGHLDAKLCKKYMTRWPKVGPVSSLPSLVSVSVKSACESRSKWHIKNMSMSAQYFTLYNVESCCQSTRKMEPDKVVPPVIEEIL